MSIHLDKDESGTNQEAETRRDLSTDDVEAGRVSTVSPASSRSAGCNEHHHNQRVVVGNRRKRPWGRSTDGGGETAPSRKDDDGIQSLWEAMKVADEAAPTASAAGMLRRAFYAGTCGCTDAAINESTVVDQLFMDKQTSTTRGFPTAGSLSGVRSRRGWLRR